MEGEDYYNEEINYNDPTVRASANKTKLTLFAKIIIAALFVAVVLIVVAIFLYSLPNPENNGGGDTDVDPVKGFILITYIERSVSEAAWANLQGGGTALTAAVSAGSAFEHFLGNLCIINDLGEQTNDAAVMSSDLRAGAVVGAPRMPKKSAVSLAHDVLLNVQHTVLYGESALDILGPITDDNYDYSNTTCEVEFETWVDGDCQPNYWTDPSLGCQGSPVTRMLDAEEVGMGDFEGFAAIVMDHTGAVSCSTLSPGLLHQFHGRVGPSAVLGASCYASEKGAAVAIGSGEVLIRSLPAYVAVDMLERGSSAGKAADEAVKRMMRIDEATTGAVFVVTNKGKYASTRCGDKHADDVQYLVQTGENATKLVTSSRL